MEIAFTKLFAYSRSSGPEASAVDRNGPHADMSEPALDEKAAGRVAAPDGEAAAHTASRTAGAAT
jgi:hypothetical protein